MKAGKIILIGSGVAAVTGLAFYMRKGSAAGKLQLDFSSAEFGLSGIQHLPLVVGYLGKLTIPKLPKQVDVTVSFNAINPTGEELKFTAPYVTLTTSTKKDPKVVGHSTPDNSIIIIPAKGSRIIPVSIKIPLVSMIAIMPDYVQYAWGRMQGEPSTRQMIAKYDYQAYGVNLTDSSIVNL